MAFLSKFERNFLFNLTRGLAIFFIFLTLAVMVIGGLVVGISQSSNGDNRVAPQEVIDKLKPTLPLNTAQPDAQQSESQTIPQTPLLPSGLKIPFILQKHFSDPDNLRKLNDWIEDLSKSEQQVFLDELAAAVTLAEKDQINAIDAINTYHELKMEKLAAEKLAKAESTQKLLWYAGAVGVGIIIIALFSLTLVLLAIERNTRRVEA
jgi:hypothetical protein